MFWLSGAVKVVSSVTDSIEGVGEEDEGGWREVFGMETVVSDLFPGDGVDELPSPAPLGRKLEGLSRSDLKSISTVAETEGAVEEAVGTVAVVVVVKGFGVEVMVIEAGVVGGDDVVEDVVVVAVVELETDVDVVDVEVGFVVDKIEIRNTGVVKSGCELELPSLLKEFGGR